MTNKLHRLLLSPSATYGRSIYGALLLVVFGGLVIPAIIGSYLLIVVREQNSARMELNESLHRYTEILALGMRGALWSMDPIVVKELAESVMQDQAVLRVQVDDHWNPHYVDVHSPKRAVGNLYRAERDIVVHGERIGRVVIEMDDAKSLQGLREKQLAYIFVLIAQLIVSLALIALFLNARLIRPLRKLMRFSDRLSHGDFSTKLDLSNRDELGRLGSQLEHMRVAIKHLFEDIGQREERFRTIVTQVPGAVFRFRPDGPIEFISKTIEKISGYPASLFMADGIGTWCNIICPEDRDLQKRHVFEGIRDGVPYEIEYRIIDASGTERWVSENGQPEQNGDGGPQWVDGIIVDISERKRSEMRISGLLAEQSVILDNVMFGIMFVRQRRIISANSRCEQLFGYAPGSMNGELTALIFPSGEEFRLAGEREYAQIGDGSYFNEERQYRKSDGSLFWCLVSGCALDSAHPNDGSIWVYADITERKLDEEKLRLAARVFDNIADGVIVSNASGLIVAVNPAFTTITGFSESEALGQRPAWLRPKPVDGAYDAVWSGLAEKGFWRGEIWNRRKNSESYLEWLTISAVRDNKGICTHHVGVFSDITLLKQSQQKLDHLAHHDPLTELPNRLLFHDRLAHAISRSSREGRQLALLFIDLDRFKNVNDTLGHHIGDELLKQVSQALASKVREGDTLARLGGDEFILLLEGVEGQYGASVVAEKLMEVFEQPFVIAEHELFVTCSVGVSLFPADGEDLNMLIRNADVAMYQSKARGRNTYCFYAPEMTGESAERLRLESQLRRSIEKNEIFLNYQPQVDIETGLLIGVEALVRWKHPELGLVPPIKFIPLAEDCGFINQLGKWVLFEACRQMQRWQDEGFFVPKIAVNLSVKQFERGGVVDIVSKILLETGLEPARLQLEVTESLIMNTDDALRFINDLHLIGIALAIDDFGTGYSSLAYLKQLPVQTLKIDQSFIKDIADDPDEEAIAIIIIQLGKSLNLSVVAEGVETKEQDAFLRRQGCRLAQGYFYDRPLSAQDLAEKWRMRTGLPENRNSMASNLVK